MTTLSFKGTRARIRAASSWQRLFKPVFLSNLLWHSECALSPRVQEFLPMRSVGVGSRWKCCLVSPISRRCMP
jgi:hypothetical protein